VRWSPDGRSFQEVVRQQWNFSAGATREVEDYGVDLAGVSVLALDIVPCIGDGQAVASLAELCLAWGSAGEPSLHCWCSDLLSLKHFALAALDQAFPAWRLVSLGMNVILTPTLSVTSNSRPGSRRSAWAWLMGPLLLVAEQQRVYRVLTTDRRDFAAIRVGPRLTRALELFSDGGGRVAGKPDHGCPPRNAVTRNGVVSATP
jgi:hypothetical protein